MRFKRKSTNFAVVNYLRPERKRLACCPFGAKHEPIHASISIEFQDNKRRRRSPLRSNGASEPLALQSFKENL